MLVVVKGWSNQIPVEELNYLIEKMVIDLELEVVDCYQNQILVER